MMIDISIRGGAAMEEMFTIEHYALKKCLTAAEKIAIPYGIREIAADAFAECINLVSVTVPDTVVRIGAGAFEGLLPFACR